ncbi:unnamed protein product [Adineta ricciae]|uniref:Uncharacterized protein n=1 Tax=Adineta ricciae TaxID=249248 RepID=A0A814L9G1_ADIRI|nr:unnamed protein product [Adineta ricciae]CAF1425164.1 unnamed protein product [Adineta ricciae]
MSFQSLNPDLTAKVLLLANLQRNLVQNPNQESNLGKQPTIIHPLVMPSLNVSSQKISAMLSALATPSIANASSTISNVHPMQSSLVCHTAVNNNNNNCKMNCSTNSRSNGSGFGWGNRERKMDENWRLQNRNI